MTSKQTWCVYYKDGRNWRRYNYGLTKSQALKSANTVSSRTLVAVGDFGSMGGTQNAVVLSDKQLKEYGEKRVYLNTKTAVSIVPDVHKFLNRPPEKGEIVWVRKLRGNEVNHYRYKVIVPNSKGGFLGKNLDFDVGTRDVRAEEWKRNPADFGDI